jgi:RNA polymerase sigma factor (TIGR02999 family)
LGPSVEITKLIAEWQSGDRAAENALFEALYTRLRSIAVQCLRSEQNAQSLNATGLVHEAYVRFRKSQNLVILNGAHFLALAARVMHRITVDRARAKKAEKHGGAFDQVEWNDSFPMAERDADEILMVDRAMEDLALRNPRFAQLVELRYFAGYTNEETADILKLSTRQVRRDWQKARNRLHDAIHGTGTGIEPL